MFKSIVVVMIVLASSACEAQLSVNEVVSLGELAAPVAADVEKARELTTWVSGSHSMEGRFLSLKSGKVELEKEDGKSIKINYADLEPEGRQRAKLFSKLMKAGNAFEEENKISASLVLMIKGLHEKNAELESKVTAQNSRLAELENTIFELKGEIAKPAAGGKTYAGNNAAGAPKKSESKPMGPSDEILKDAGDAGKTTEMFTLSGANEFIEYSFNDTSGSEAAVLQVMLYESKSKQLINMVIHKKGAGTSDTVPLKAKAGTYFMKLNASNCNWSLRVAKRDP